MRLGCWGAIVGAALIWGGGQGVYTSLRNREPTKATCAEVEAKTPDADWLVLSGCAPHMTEMAYESRLGRATKVYLPLRPDGDEEGAAKVLLVSEDPALVELVQKIETAGDDEEAVLKVAVAAVELVQADVSGVVRFGIELDSDDVAQLRGLNPNLPEDFLLVAHNEEPPSALLAGLAFLGGVVLLGAMGASALRNVSDDEDDEPEDDEGDAEAQERPA